MWEHRLGSHSGEWRLAFRVQADSEPGALRREHDAPKPHFLCQRQGEGGEKKQPS